MACFVGQAGFPGHVTDGINPLDSGPAKRVDLDKAMRIERHARGIKSDIFDIWLHSNRDQDICNSQLFLAAFMTNARADRFLSPLQPVDFGTEDEVNSLLPHDFLCDIGNLPVDGR